MWNEYDHTYEERAEFFKQLIQQLEDENIQLRSENEMLSKQLEECLNLLGHPRNPEDAYREDFTPNDLTFN